jgi:hypothetical protein
MESSLPLRHNLLISAETPKDQIPHAQVLQEANHIYQEKSLQRGDMWRQFPVGDKIRELRERVTRIEAISQREGLLISTKNDLLIEEGLDIINYTVFMIRQLREGTPG